MATFTITFRKSIIEFYGFSAVYIRVGSFERFWNTEGYPSH
ncbi:hypothetical protein SAMN05216404_1104 [Nitrosospira multiformis]|uniref:Uncharacterized protein n=1 Tax=Nitrosospira multiformis TaxID=1231 RepID=A0A1H8L8C7_9PROT|nr:hypothetical protein [Nitrosospira multiformis]SEO00968.1 hypothetical protein SAMN05216404_1104 [Nitrosospira multiformis]